MFGLSPQWRADRFAATQRFNFGRYLIAGFLIGLVITTFAPKQPSLVMALPMPV